MRYLYLLMFVAGITLTSTNVSSQSFTVTGSSNPTQLVGNLLGAGIFSSNVTGQISNVTAGTFVSNNVQGFSLPSGIILSTGNVNNLLGPATILNSTDAGMPGYALLDQIVSPEITYDAQVLSFDFQAGSDSVEFNFVFSSEEYNEYANTSFNDVFAFFVTGPGYLPNTNVALLPGTTIPVSINTVNNGQSNGQSTGPCMNCNYYIDNVGTNAVGLSHDGYTVTMKIKFPVWPCSPYHFDIALADVADHIFDSSVMLESNSFIACPGMTAYHNGHAANDTMYMCTGGVLTLSTPPATNFTWSTGDTTQSIVVTQPGTYQYFINVGNCYSMSKSIKVLQLGNIQTPVISQAGNTLTSNVVGAGNTYQWNLDGNPIAGADQNNLAISGNGCYTLSVFQGTCEALSNVVCVTNTGLNQLPDYSVSIIPNPFTDNATIQTPFKNGTSTTIKVFDIAGRNVRSEKTFSGNVLSFEKGNLIPGIYFLEISNSGFSGVVRKKIVIQ